MAFFSRRMHINLEEVWGILDFSRQDDDGDDDVHDNGDDD